MDMRFYFSEKKTGVMSGRQCKRMNILRERVEAGDEWSGES